MNRFQSKSSGQASLKDFYGDQAPKSQLAAVLRKKRRKRARNRGMELSEDEYSV